MIRLMTVAYLTSYFAAVTGIEDALACLCTLYEPMDWNLSTYEHITDFFFAEKLKKRHLTHLDLYVNVNAVV